MVIGLTGGVGSGKSTVTDILEKRYGFLILKADDIAKELELPGGAVYKRLIAEFGRAVLEEPDRADSPIDKAKFAALIYSDREALAVVNAIVHPAVWQYIRDRISEEGSGRSIAVESALPDESFEDICDTVWYIYVGNETRIERLMASRGYTREKCISIIESQRSDREFEDMADYIIDNSGPEEQTAGQIEELLK